MQQGEANTPSSSAQEFDFSVVPTPATALQVTRLPDAPRLLAVSVHLPDAPEAVSAPAFAEHTLNIHAQGTIQARGRNVMSFGWQPVTPAALCITPAGEPTEWQRQGACDNLLLFLHPTLLENAASQSGEADPGRLELIPRIFTPDPLVHQLGLAISETLRTGGVTARLYLDSLTHTLAAHLLRYHASFPVESPRLEGRLPAPVLRRVMEAITEQPDADLSLDRLAQIAHLSPYHFARLFKATTGQTVHQAVLETRLRAARQLISSSDLPLAEIARQTGFADQSHLAHRFKQAFGFAPGALRQDRKIRQPPGKILQDTSA